MKVEVNRIVRGEINKISDRAAMGLPEGYTSPACERLTLSASALPSARELLDGMSDPDRPFEERLSLALLLNFHGDPRIDVFDPAMVDVPSGVARLGLDEGRLDELASRYKTYGVHRNWLEKECPRFEQRMRTFRIGRYPVTNGEYRAFLKENKTAGIPTSWPDGRMPILSENTPAYSITPQDADAYAAWLAAKADRPFRLPTEYEWEYAAGGPDGYDYPWGDVFDARACNTLESGLLRTTPVGLFPEGDSWVGAQDMAGNVEEYVATSYHAYPGGTIVEDDLYTLLGFYRIARGGAYNRFQDLARCQRRHGPYPKSRYAMGFRIAEEIV